MILKKFSIILIILFLMFERFLKINNRARKNYWSAPYAACTEGEKFILRELWRAQV